MTALPHPRGSDGWTTSVVPVLLSLVGLLALAYGAAYTGREVITQAVGLLSAG